MAGPVNVRSYTRADGTRVSAHTRALPAHTAGAGISGVLVVAAVAAIVVLTGGSSAPGSRVGTPAASSTTPSKVVQAIAHDPAGLPVRALPGPEGPILGTIPDGATIQVLCYSRGPMAAGWGNTSPYWNKVSYAGLEGFTADVNLDTGRQVYLVAPRC